MTIESIPVSPIVAAVPALRLERQPCTRCGGSGHYSYCQMYGTTCFLCQGKKEILTKRGAAAAEFLRTLRTRKVSEVKVGDVVKCSTFGYGTVIAIEPYTQEGASLQNGVMVPFRTECLLFRCKSFSAIEPINGKIEMKLSSEQTRANLILAIEYQNTLTKQGTVRKRS